MMLRVGLAVIGAALLAACGGGSAGVPAEFRTGAPQKLGDPIEGLDREEYEAFLRGREVFERRFKPSEGLGPFYNATSCASCHSTPVTGGSAGLYRNFYLVRRGDPRVPGAQIDLLDLPSAVVPSFGPRGPHAPAKFSLEGGRTIIPHADPTVTVAQRNTLRTHLASSRSNSRISIKDRRYFGARMASTLSLSGRISRSAIISANLNPTSIVGITGTPISLCKRCAAPPR